jgi:ATP-binding cassette subfamily F protein 3
VKTIEKIERIIVRPDPKEAKVRFAPVDRSGDIVVKMEDLSKTWPLPDGSRGGSCTLGSGGRIGYFSQY